MKKSGFRRGSEEIKKVDRWEKMESKRKRDDKDRQQKMMRGEGMERRVRIVVAREER